MAILCAVMAATNGFLALVSILFYLDYRSRDRSRTGWEDGVLLTLNEHTRQIAVLQAAATLARSQPAIGLSRPFQPSPAQVATARAISSAPVSSETPAAMRARIVAAEDERDRKRELELAAAKEAAAQAPREGTYETPTLASIGTVLGWLSDLSSEDLARVDALADEIGLSREEMLGRLFGAGSATMSANDAPVTPDAPANDEPTVPPPSGRRRT
jgi:hypothetical protein